ncbi:CGNR zinc finger domain-containing protein [Micromonospora sp. M12]
MDEPSHWTWSTPSGSSAAAWSICSTNPRDYGCGLPSTGSRATPHRWRPRCAKRVRRCAASSSSPVRTPSGRSTRSWPTVPCATPSGRGPSGSTTTSTPTGFLLAGGHQLSGPAAPATHPDPTLRQPACVLHFYDTSRNGTRRWCSMDGCGGRAKAARHYQRHRAAPPPGSPRLGSPRPGQLDRTRSTRSGQWLFQFSAAPCA